jgi:hypothetical protein
MNKLTQELPTGLILKALNFYQSHLDSIQEDIGLESFTKCETFSNDHFDLCSLIPIIAHSSLEATFSEHFYENFNALSIDGVDYPPLADEFKLYQLETSTSITKKLIKRED